MLQALRQSGTIMRFRVPDDVLCHGGYMHRSHVRMCALNTHSMHNSAHAHASKHTRVHTCPPTHTPLHKPIHSLLHSYADPNTHTHIHTPLTLLHRRGNPHQLFVLSTLDLKKRKDAAAVREIFAQAEAANVPVVKASRHDLNLLSHDRPHQGLVLDVNPLNWATLDEFPSADEAMEASRRSLQEAAAAGANVALTNLGSPPVWLALDEVVDPVGGG